MAQRKNYYPNRVSRNERLAYQLEGDRKITVTSVRGLGEHRRKADAAARLNANFPLCEFVSQPGIRKYQVNWDWRDKSKQEEVNAKAEVANLVEQVDVQSGILSDGDDGEQCALSAEELASFAASYRP